MRRDGRELPRRSERLYLRLPPADAAWFKFALEARDNLGLLTMVDRRACVLRLLFAPGKRPEVEAFLAAMRRDVPELAVRFDPARHLDQGGSQGVAQSQGNG